MELQTSQCSLCPSTTGAQSQVGWLRPQGLGAPSLPDPRAPVSSARPRGEGARNSVQGTVGPTLGVCVLTLQSAPDPTVWEHRTDFRV